MAVKHSHVGEQRAVEAMFIADDALYTVSLYYPIASDSLYGEYSEQFYRSIQLG